jgi:predicted ABC-type ATPase
LLLASVVKQIPRIYVLAGTNGAGKSSIAGAMLIEQGVEYFDPDAAAALIANASPGITLEEAQSAAWYEGRRLLQRALAERLDFAFETTLGGTTITALLQRAIALKLEVRIWYVGLESVERHIARVRARVEAGGHDIPEEKIRERYPRSLMNLILLMPKLTELRVYDNSKEADPRRGSAPSPRLLVHLDRGRLAGVCELAATPDWAKPLVLTALKISTG